MSLKDHLPKSVADALFEPEEAPAPSQPIPAVLPARFIPPSNFGTIAVQSSADVASSAGFPNTVVSMSQAGLATSPVTSAAVASILADLRSKTDFDATPSGQHLKNCREALADSGMTEQQIVKTAMKLSHESPAQVVSVLQELQAVLASDRQQFEATMQAATSAEVDSRHATATQLSQAIEDAEAKIRSMRQERDRLDAELLDKKLRIVNAQKNYAAASEARNTELAEMISRYQSISEGK